MTEQSSLTQEFDRARGRLRAVAFRLLGSVADADDAVQEAWLRASGADLGTIANVAGWLTTIVSRVSLDMLRARRREHARGPHDAQGAEEAVSRNPEEEQLLVESVGLAMLVVLERLGPQERLAFVLHDMCSVPFDDIAKIVERTPVAAKKLASRARQRVHGATPPPEGARRHWELVETFLAAARAGDVDGLIAVLAPDVVRRVDRGTREEHVPAELRGAEAVARETAGNAARAMFARPILVDGEPGVAVAPRGRLHLVIRIDVEGDRIASFEVVGEREVLRALELTVPGPAPAQPAAAP